MSLDVMAEVNLKLSDYGISKYSWGGRSVGLVGTIGYQAPEILDGVAYDEKVRMQFPNLEFCKSFLPCW